MSKFVFHFSQSQVLALHRVLSEALEDFPQEWWADKEEFIDVDDVKSELESVVESI